MTSTSEHTKIESIFRIIGLVLHDFDRMTETTEDDAEQQKQPPQQRSPIARIEKLLQEIKQTLHDNYENDQAIKVERDEEGESKSKNAEFHDHSGVAIASFLNILVERFERTIERGRAEKHRENPSTAITESRLYRYVLIGTLIRSVAAVYHNLLNPSSSSNNNNNNNYNNTNNYEGKCLKNFEAKSIEESKTTEKRQNFEHDDLVGRTATILSSNGDTSMVRTTLSTNQVALLRLALSHTVRVAFLPELSRYFASADRLFACSRNLTVKDHENEEENVEKEEEKSVACNNSDNCDNNNNNNNNNGQDELSLLKPIYLILLRMLLPVCEEEATVEAEESNVKDQIRSPMTSAPNSAVIAIQEAIRNDCYAPLIACFAIFRKRNLLANSKSKNFANNIEREEESDDDDYDDRFAAIDVSIRRQFERHIAIIENQPFVIRDLLLLVRCKPNAFLQPILINMCSKYFTQPNGIEIVLQSILDSDLTSERRTTINERLIAISSMIGSLPVNNKQRQAQYDLNILRQTIRRLLPAHASPQFAGLRSDHPIDIYWRVGALIFENIAQRNAQLGTLIFDSIMATFRGDTFRNENDDPIGSQLILNDINDCLLIVHRLLLARVCIEGLARFVAPIFFVRVAFESYRISQTRTLLDQILLDALREIPKSYLLLDECVHERANEWADRFALQIDDSKSDHTIRHRICVKSESGQIENKQNGEEGREQSSQAKTIATVAAKLTSQMSRTFRFEFFFTLFGRFAETRPPLVTALLIERLAETLLGSSTTKNEEERRESQMLSEPQCIKFLSTTFERIVNRFLAISGDRDFGENDNYDEADEQLTLQYNNLRLCLAILLAILDALQPPKTCSSPSSSSFDQKSRFGSKQFFGAKEDKNDMVIELRRCKISLGELLRHANIFEHGIDRLQVEDIYSRLEEMLQSFDDRQEHENDGDDDNQLSGYLDELRHPLMPVRAHALFAIKRLIDARHHTTIQSEQNFDRIFAALRQCCADTESYIYLAAINALASLAIHRTEQVLPLLLDPFVGALDTDRRSLADRLKIGEVLLKLAQSIGDMAPHYGRSFISAMLRCIRVTDSVAIRISALSILGAYCGSLRASLPGYIIELASMIESFGRDHAIEVKRSATWCMRQILQTLTPEIAVECRKAKPDITRALHAYAHVLDDVVQTNVSLARDELDRAAKEVIASAFAIDERNLLNQKKIIPID